MKTLIQESQTRQTDSRLRPSTAPKQIFQRPPKAAPQSFEMRHPDAQTGSAMWELVKATGVLDLNSAYLYLMMGHYYGQTCIVAEQADQIMGFVMGFIPPDRPDTYFLWQVGVSEKARGQGLATRMIQHLFQQSACAQIRYLETTITPSNQASRRLFQGLARRLNTQLEIREGFDKSLFPTAAQHESEELFYIGPFVPQTQATQEVKA